MREILFRGKWIRNGKWVEGFYARLYDGKGNVSHRIYSGYAESDCGEFYPEWFEVDPSTIGQFTGLYDAADRPIFEGDFLKWDVQEWGCPHNELVEWDYTLFAARKEDWRNWCVVNGNIHDNPELLEGKDER